MLFSNKNTSVTSVNTSPQLSELLLSESFTNENQNLPFYQWSLLDEQNSPFTNSDIDLVPEPVLPPQYEQQDLPPNQLALPPVLPPAQPAPMAVIQMPARGEHTAPIFDKERPRELSRFFDDLEMLFICTQVLNEVNKKKYIVYYPDFETKQIWKTFPEYTSILSTYKDFKDTILVHYPDVTGDYVYSLCDMDTLIGE